MTLIIQEPHVYTSTSQRLRCHRGPAENWLAGARFVVASLTRMVIFIADLVDYCRGYPSERRFPNDRSTKDPRIAVAGKERREVPYHEPRRSPPAHKGNLACEYAGISVLTQSCPSRKGLSRRCTLGSLTKFREQVKKTGPGGFGSRLHRFAREAVEHHPALRRTTFFCPSCYGQRRCISRPHVSHTNDFAIVTIPERVCSVSRREDAD